MEVDLFRPGTVPISSETILWFEFLLDQDLLLRHLEKPTADPPPSELITKFYDVISETLRINPDNENGEIINVDTNVGKSKSPARTVALKILSLKVGAYLKWNLVQIRKLPFKTQINLLQDLMYFTNDKKTVEIPNVEDEDVKTASPPYLFALLLFHRWLLNTSMHRITSNWQIRYGINDISPADESIICCPENINKTVNFLTDSLDWDIVPSLLTFDCFKLPTENNDCIEFDWSKSQELSKNEFNAQINYDLGVFFFYREQYDLAKKHFSKCLELFSDIPEINGFYDLDKNMLDVYIKACHGSADIQQGSLLEQLNSSIVNQYMLVWFLQDFGYVILAKSKEQLLNKNFNLSLEFLIILEKELQTVNMNVTKLFKLVSWEILLVQITQLLDQWPKHTVDRNALADACEVCLQTTDSVIPRTEVVEQCAICLLNLARWDFLINLEKRWTTFEITSAIALACQEILKQKGSKKLSKNLWEIVLPVFLSNPQSKRNTSSYDMSNLKSNLLSVFFKLKDSWCLSVVISLLTKMFNVLKDECSLELQVDYTNLWPAVVSNANSYSSESVCELLSEIVTRALKDYPTNVPWLRLMGDINFANGHYRVSLSFYLKSLLISHDYFNIPIHNDDHVFRRMIKCCTTLGCHTQAAVLCQFLEETDYLLAFRILADQKTSSDAVDAYYHCFWDPSILEYLIHTHHKKGEYQRRKSAIQVIGLLELNSSNNEEIQREASNLRKSTFLRALCKQYVF
nr:integrator complex subunit 8 [Leptinotarsa decemlineata]